MRLHNWTNCEMCSAVKLSMLSLFNVELDEQSWRFIPVQAAGHVAQEHEVIMDASGFDESTLTAGDQIVHLWAKPRCHGLCNDLRDDVDEANRPEVGNRVSAIFLWEKSNIGR